MKKLILSFLVLLFSIASFAQNNVSAKAFLSYNASDTTFIHNTRSALQILYGSTGGLYFDKVRDKWRIWAGTCNTCAVDSAWIDLPLSAGGGAGTLSHATNGVHVSGDTVILGGALNRNTVISSTTTDLFFGSLLHPIFSTTSGMEFVTFGNDLVNAPASTHAQYRNLSNAIHNTYIIGGSTVVDELVQSNGRYEMTQFSNSGNGVIYSSNLGELYRMLDGKISLLGINTSQSYLSLPHNTLSASSSPIKIQTGGVLMNVTEPGSIETTNSHIYWTDNISGGTRWQLDQQGGGGVSSVSITAGTNITQSGSPITGSGSITINAVPSGLNSLIQINSGGVFGSNGNLSYNTTSNELSAGRGLFTNHNNAGSINLTPSSTPSTPVNGDLWQDNSLNHLFTRINGVTYQLDQQGGGTPAGSNTQIQFNNSGSFGADSRFVYFSATNTQQLNSANGNTISFAGSSSSAGGENIQIVDTNNTLSLDPAGVSLVGTQATTGFTIESLSASGNTGKITYLTDLTHTFDSRLSNTTVVISRIPTSSAGLPSGALYSVAGVINIVP